MADSSEIERLTYQLFKTLYLNNRNSGQMTQGKILKILYKNGKMSQKDMQEKLQVKSGSMSELINKLENKKLIVRLKDEDDRRKVILYLTDEGKKDVERYQKEYQNNVTHYFDVLNKDEKKELKRLMLKLLEQGE